MVVVVALVVPVAYHQRRRFGDELVMEERKVREGKRVTRKFGMSTHSITEVSILQVTSTSSNQWAQRDYRYMWISSYDVERKR